MCFWFNLQCINLKLTNRLDSYVQNILADLISGKYAVKKEFHHNYVLEREP